MNDSKFRDKVIAEYNTLRQVRPTIQEIMNKVGCSRATVMNFVREYRASIGESHQPQRKRLS